MIARVSKGYIGVQCPWAVIGFYYAPQLVRSPDGGARQHYLPGHYALVQLGCFDDTCRDLIYSKDIELELSNVPWGNILGSSQTVR